MCLLCLSPWRQGWTVQRLARCGASEVQTPRPKLLSLASRSRSCYISVRRDRVKVVLH
ncbi:hypothetical protein FA15DRAFT_254829 [Coprinopsis marcescibilis]|uniref:Uncharacterized protein n=1 Tax=Coprinopsis marcescibilis TaxID=230819 RepID=A0A5C3KE89_COPMA|nr:hypothetical protein FA15DRAFT_254829 [Coprinopsis marcescibilis]